MLKNQKGQTLIEVLVTVLFIAVGVIALIRFQNYLGYNTTLTQQKGYATILAISQIETLRDFQVLNNTAGYTSYQSLVSGSSTVTSATTTFTITWTITNYTSPTYKTIDVVVSWNDRTGTAQSIRYITNVAGIDPQTSAGVI